MVRALDEARSSGARVRLPVIDPPRPKRAYRRRGAPAPSTSFVVWRGPSRFDGRPIVAVVTNVTRSGSPSASKNEKTGPMAQLHVLVADEAPNLAQRSGHDASVCGSCPLRNVNAKASGGTYCYVNVAFSETTTWRANGHLQVDLEGCLASVRELGLRVRVGAYGDPAALPEDVVRAVVGASSGATSYTHDWRSERSGWLKPYAMASVEREEDAEEAAAAGWRTFRIVRGGSAAQSPALRRDEVLCPNVTHGTLCDDCLLCDGKRDGSDGRRSVVILEHGRSPGRRRVCPTCGEEGHFAKTCPERPRRVGEDRAAKALVLEGRPLVPNPADYQEMGREEEARLIAAFKAGDDVAGGKLLAANDRLIFHFTKKFRRRAYRGLDYDDVLQVAREKFLYGVKEKFDPAMGYRLSTYVQWWIRSAATREVRNMDGDVRVPIHAREALLREERTLSAEGRATERAEDGGVDGGEASKRKSRRDSPVELARVFAKMLSMDAPVYGPDGREMSLVETVASKGASALDELLREEDREEAREDVAALLACLSPREKVVFLARHVEDEDGETKTLAEIGDGLGLSKERVRQIERRAVARMRAVAEGEPTFEPRKECGGKNRCTVCGEVDHNKQRCPRRHAPETYCACGKRAIYGSGLCRAHLT